MSTIKDILYGNSTQTVFRKNYLQENRKHIREMQKCFQSNKVAEFPGSRSNSVRCLSSKPRSKSSQPRARVQPVGNSVKRLDRPVTALASKVNSVKELLNEKAVGRSGSGTLSLQQTKFLAGKCPLQTAPHGTDQQNSNSAKSVTCQCVLTRKEPDPKILHPTDLPSLPSAKTYKDSSSQTLEIQNLDKLYSEGVIVYPSSSALTAGRLASDKPIRLDSATQTDRGHSFVETCSHRHNVPAKQMCNESNIDHLHIQEMTIDDCKENVQDQNITTTNSRNSSSKHKCASGMSNSFKPPTTYQKGVVPRYLRERQQQWQKAIEEELANAPDPSCPLGHVLLPEEERKQTLDMINKDYANMVRELNMMPVRTDTLRLRQRKIELEKKLTKLEEAAKVFSRPKVFVKVGE